MIDFDLLSSTIPNATRTELFGMPALQVDSTAWNETAARLHAYSPFPFNFLVTLFAEDRQDQGLIVYAHLRSTTAGADMCLSTTLSQEQPFVDSLTSLYASAEWCENEVYDLMGIHFTHHPNLRRIFVGDSFEGYPLRKTFQSIKP